MVAVKGGEHIYMLRAEACPLFFFFFEAMLPAAENQCADGVDVAGIHNRDFASLASVG